MDPSLEIVVHPLSDDQRNAWRVASIDVTEQLIEKLGGRARDIYALILKGKAEYQGNQVNPEL